MNRRVFLKTATAIAAASPSPILAQARTSADVVLVNGAVTTLDPSRRRAEAVATRAGRILAVGSRTQIEALCDRRTRVVDLGGKGVSPGLIDAHSHLTAFGHMELHFVVLRPPEIHDFGTLCSALADAAAARPAGQWVVGRGFSDFDEGRFPRRQELDEATPRHPVLIIHWTGQYGVANTLGLKTAGLLSADVSDPYGGKFLRDERSGVPNGCLLHYPAIYAVYQPTMSDADELTATGWGMQRFLEQGVTCVHDNFCTGQSARNYVALERSGELALRVRAYPYVANLEQCQQAVAQMRRYEGPLVRMQGLKLAVDGYPLMYQEVRNRAQVNMPMHPQDRFEAIVSTIHRAGLQVDVHAAGDRGVDWTLDAFSKAAGGDRAVRERRHRIEHYMFRKEDSIRRTGEMGVPVCTQPAWIPLRAGELSERLRAADVETMVPVRSFLDAGVPICFGADVPASPTHLPLDSIRSAMLRRTADGRELGASERVNFLEALEAHTKTAAYAAFDEADLGTIEPGKCADFTIWNMDLEQVNEANVGQLAAVGTYVGGRAVWEV